MAQQIPNDAEPSKPFLFLHMSSVEKLQGPNFQQWRVQLESLLLGYGLHGYLTGDVAPPPATLPSSSNDSENKSVTAETPNPAYLTWFRQDKLVYGALATTLGPSIGPLIIRCTTAKTAWEALLSAYAKPSRVHLKVLRHKLKNIKKGNTAIPTYLSRIKAVADELAMLGDPVNDEDLQDYILTGLDDSRYNGFVESVQFGRDTTILYPELLEKLINLEHMLDAVEPTPQQAFPASANATSYRAQSRPQPYHKHSSGSQNRNNYKEFKGRCQWCNIVGHTLYHCPTFKELYPHIQVPRHSRYSVSPSTSASTNTTTSSHSSRPQINTTVPRSIVPSSWPLESDQPLPSTPWLLDTGASHHVTMDHEALAAHFPYDGTDEIVVGNGAGLHITHTGYTTLFNSSHKFQLNNVLCVPLMRKNIISVTQFCNDNNVFITFSSNSFFVKDPRTGKILLQGTARDGEYYWPRTLSPKTVHAISSHAPDYHHRFGHPSLVVLNKILSSLCVKNYVKDFICDACFTSKSTKLSFHDSSLVSTRPLDVIFSDVWTSPLLSYDNYKYNVIFVDHFTKYIWLYPLKFKSDTYNVFIRFKALVEKKFQHPIKTLYSDNGGEFLKLASFLATNGISHLTSPPHTPEHNGYAERRHRHIVDTGLALLNHASLPLHFWSHTFQTASYLINRMPTYTLNHQSPYHKLFGYPPNYAYLHNFGCLCYPWLRPYTSHKLDNRSIACIFVGYSPTQYAYLCLDPKTNRLYSSRHVRFIDTHYPLKNTTSITHPTTPTPLPWLPLLHPTTPTASAPAPSATTTPPPLPPAAPPLTPTTPAAILSSPHVMTTPNPSPPTPTLPTSQQSHRQSFPPPSNTPHPYGTRASHNIFKPIDRLNLSAQLTPTPSEPTTIKQALADPQWHAAMLQQHKALLTNKTWDLVPRSATQNVIGCKWVFRLKYKPDGSLDKYKARLVAKGFHQRPGLDYNETFSPVVKPATVRVILTLAITNSWPLRQLDINDAFLQGTLHDEVHMTQPPGFVDPTRPTHVCRLRKALYGLKQAPRAWYTELRQYLTQIGFTNAVSDTSLFLRHGSSSIYLLVYVDDIIITGSTPHAVDTFVTTLANRFSLKDLGPLSYFLGVEVIPCAHGLFLNQQKYIRDLLHKTNMDDAKPASTPLDPNAPLTLTSGTPLSNPTDYRTIVGSLQYLSLTRPDTAFAVNKLSQFMHSPTTNHWKALKRLLRYLKGTLHHGLNIYRHSTMLLHAFSNSDWAGDKDDYISTGAYIVYLGKNPISWSSKKQRSVARSSTEAEYRSIANAAAELTWLQNLFQELRLQITATPTVFCDNHGATSLSANPVFHSRMKHLALDYHFIREKVQSGKLRVTRVANDDQLADALTKPLARPRLHLLLTKIGLTPRPSILRGHVKE
ncbi:hypothetical protein vseg_014258 [Gypsophila vaccaria]